MMVGWSGGVPKGLTCGKLRCGAVSSEALFLKLFFDADFFRFFAIFGGFWEVLGGQNGGKNRVLGGFFSMFFSSAFRHRFFVEFGRLGR